ncbi:hypothetical protein D1P53_003275 [Cryptococcus gattii VGV]|nr:hypothetical protein D1P53_003275 [Cryptococcus gattii VGV]
MTSLYSKGTLVWISQPLSGWVAGTVESLDLPADGDSSSEVVMTVSHDSDSNTIETLKFPLSTLQSATTDPTSIQTTTLSPGQDCLPVLRNPPALETAEDLANLSNLNEPSVLHAMATRYMQHYPYTYSGIVLLSMNPFTPLNIYETAFVKLYAGQKKGEREPHVFAIAEEALDSMRRGDGGGGVDPTGAGDQTIIVSGESGAGKTVAAKYILRYFASAHYDSTQSTIVGEDGMSEVEKQILASNPIMEAFGNAKTTRNDNTSERNYHIFYQLLAGAPSKERKDLSLSTTPRDFGYLAGGGPTSTSIPGVDDSKEFAITQSALSTVGISIERQWHIFRLLAALLHLGNIKISQIRTDAALADDDSALNIATDLLGIPLSDFKKWIIKKQLTTRNEKIVTSLGSTQALVVRDSVAKFLYNSLFHWLVGVVNDSLAGNNEDSRAVKFIGVLDIYGFEHFTKNSFEQFCINWANEKLQQEFYAHVFKLEQEEYVREQISWKFIEFADNQACIDIIEGKMGVLALLDEESRLPGGSDTSFATKLHQELVQPWQKKVFKRPRFQQGAFTITHYAHEVTYDVEGFVEKNRDSVPEEHLSLLQSSTNGFLCEVLAFALKSSEAPSQQSFKTPLVVSKRVTPRKHTLGSMFKNSLASLMDTINNTNVHYIRCIKPNEAKKAWELDSHQVLSQLRACGVLETIRISCDGYPSRWEYAQFAESLVLMVTGSAARREYQTQVKRIVVLQSQWRRKLAVRELASLKIEAKSATKLKEISYQLENKVVELTQALQKRLSENKELMSRVAALESETAVLNQRNNELLIERQELEQKLSIALAESSNYDSLVAQKEEVEFELRRKTDKDVEQREEIRLLTAQLDAALCSIEETKASLNLANNQSVEDKTTIDQLRSELSHVREKLSRTNTLNALTKGNRSREGPPSPSAGQGFRHFENAIGLGAAPDQVPVARRRNRRHSMTSGSLFAGDGSHDANQPVKLNPRSASTIYTQDITLHSRDSQGLPLLPSLTNASDEITRLLEDEVSLDDDVLQGLIYQLKIPNPSLHAPPTAKDVLFPAHLISLVSNEMWKRHMRSESERFLAVVMSAVQRHVVEFKGEDIIVPGIFWLSNIQEILSFISFAEDEESKGYVPGYDFPNGQDSDWRGYIRLLGVVKHDLDSLEYNIYHTFMLEIKKKLSKMVVPALIESQSLPGFITSEGSGVFSKMLGGIGGAQQPAAKMDDILNLLNKVWKCLKIYYMEESVTHQVMTELLKLIGQLSFNDLLMRRNFSSWKREWCKAHDMPEGLLQLEHLLQATKLLQLKKATLNDIDILFDVCWILSPAQVQKLISQYHTADYEAPLNAEILRAVAARVKPEDKNDQLLLAPETDDVGPYQLPPPREIMNLETYVPAWLNIPTVRRLAALVA